ncbi:MAG: hypothetical protein M1840_006718 [Geoglossum simile]|nr:MAG: hypothetical protein M1840_006718 [Geoglossum simile]
MLAAAKEDRGQRGGTTNKPPSLDAIRQPLTQMQSQTQSSSPAVELVRKQLANLPLAQREAFYEQTLVQSGAIHIMSDGTFSKLEREPALTWRLTIPTHAGDTLAAEAAQVFYSRNEFAVSVKSLYRFTASWVGSYYRPSDLVTRLAVIYGPSPGGGNRELLYVLAMPGLYSVRLIFRDRPGKSQGASVFLRPSAWAVIELQQRVALTLQLRKSGSLSEHEEEDKETLAGPLEDITGFIIPPTATDAWAYECSQSIVTQYKGPMASVDNILEEGGWPFVYTHGIGELYARLSVRRWAGDQQLEMLWLRDAGIQNVGLQGVELQDTEMS